MNAPLAAPTPAIDPSRQAALADLLSALAETAAQRDREGGTAKHERDLIRASGLLKLSTPLERGGLGGDWVEIFGVVRALARVDSSLAHLFAFHHLMIATLQFFGSEDQARGLMATSARENWFWGNALNPKDERLRLASEGKAWRLDGEKSFCSGASDSDRLIVSALDERGKLVVAAIPTDRDGVRIHDDWNNMGQRQTDSGTVSFSAVSVAQEELLISPGPLGSPFATLRPCLAQLILVNIYAGIARGAFEQARAYIKELPKAAFERVGSDAFVQRTAGELWAQIAASETLVEKASKLFDTAWGRGQEITPTERGCLAIEIACAKMISAQAALNISTRIFDVMGARSTAERYRLDRFWRNARTHTLHDPLDQKLKEIGDWALNGAYPTPSFYS
jgi:alkylation response protein AidB-like acyl-CoA dehydrogenase